MHRSSHRGIKVLLAAGLSLSLALGSATLASADSSADPGDGLGAALGADPVAGPAGMSKRFEIPYYTSQTALAGSRSVTVVAISNPTGRQCEVAAQFFYGSGDLICEVATTLGPQESVRLCSRSVNDPLTACTATCSPGLTFNTGFARVFSEGGLRHTCKRLGVDAKLYFTSDVADDNITGVADLTVVRRSGVLVGD